MGLGTFWNRCLGLGPDARRRKSSSRWRPRGRLGAGRRAGAWRAHAGVQCLCVPRGAAPPPTAPGAYGCAPLAILVGGPRLAAGRLTRGGRMGARMLTTVFPGLCRSMAARGGARPAAGQGKICQFKLVLLGAYYVAGREFLRVGRARGSAAGRAAAMARGACAQ